MEARTMDEKRRLVVPPEVCEAADLQPGDMVDFRFEDGEIRGRKLVPAEKPEEPFPPGSLKKFFTPERNKEELAILKGCVQGPK